jgi:dihydroorotate dehydrogenase electron transfer subunit
MKQHLLTMSRNHELMPGIHLMWLEAPGVVRSAKAGQYVTVRCGDLTLRRPLSIHHVSSTGIALLFRIAGQGTLWLSQRQPGEGLDVLGPLGNGFSMPGAASGQSQRLLLLAGGMGIAPLAFLAHRAASRHHVTLIHGASTAAQLYPWTMARTVSSSPYGGQGECLALPEGVEFIPVTEDGSAGKRGLITDVLPGLLDRVDQVYACGPVGMYEAMQAMICHSERGGESRSTSSQLRQELKLRRCQVSLEVRLGCGFGACYGCTIKTRRGLRQVCRDGPVFELDDVIWPEVKL